MFDVELRDQAHLVVAVDNHAENTCIESTADSLEVPMRRVIHQLARPVVRLGGEAQPTSF